MRALIIEDDPVIADFIGRGLREAGFVVDHAADGEAGLDGATTRRFDVAIVDLMLPRLRRPVGHPGDAAQGRPDAGPDPERHGTPWTTG